MPRSRGAATGVLLILLGVAAALAPLLGPEIGLKKTFDVTQDRLLLSIIPGAAAAVGGLLLLVSASRPMAMLGALLALAGGIWLIVGPLVSRLWEDSGGLLGAAGRPDGDRTRQTLEILTYFHGTGALITALAGIGLGRLAIKAASDRDRDRDRDRAVPAPAVARQPRQPVSEEPTHREPVTEGGRRDEPLLDEPTHRPRDIEEPSHREPVADDPPQGAPVVDQPTRPEPDAGEQPTRVVEPPRTDPADLPRAGEPASDQRPPDPAADRSGGGARRSGGFVGRVRDRFS
jgi:hypothetical protein